MKKVLLAAVAVMTLAAPAFAATTQSATVRTTAPQRCAVEDPATFVVNLTLANDITNLTQFGTITSASSPAQSINIACNTPSSFSLDAAKMTNAQPVSSASASVGYTNELDFQVSFKGGREGDTTGAWWAKNTAGAPTGSATGRPSSFDFGIYAVSNQLIVEEVANVNTGKRPVKGQYNGSVTLTLTP